MGNLGPGLLFGCDFSSVGVIACHSHVLIV